MVFLEALRGNAPTGKSPLVRPLISRPARPAAGAIYVELHHLRACSEILAHWRDLARRALQPNVFYEPDIALAAAQHLVGAEMVQVVLAWSQSDTDGQRTLLGFFPVKLPGSLSPFRQVRGMRSPFFASGVPLIDRDCAPEVLSAILAWLSTTDAPGSSYLLPQVDLDGQFARILFASANASGNSINVISRHLRAGFKSTDGGQNDLDRDSRLGRLKVLRQQIAMSGTPTIVEASEGIALRDAVEIYLAMEASGQRGRAGTAMMMQTRTGTFLRAATRGLGRGHHCRTMMLMQGEIPMAIALIYESSRTAWLVDLVRDEAFARYAPDEFLTLALMERQSRRNRIGFTQFCSTSARAELDQLWPEEFAMADILVGPRITRRPASLAVDAKASLARRTGLLLRRFAGRTENRR
jgi:hypothetical protein